MLEARCVPHALSHEPIGEHRAVWNDRQRAKWQVSTPCFSKAIGRVAAEKSNNWKSCGLRLRRAYPNSRAAERDDQFPAGACAPAALHCVRSRLRWWCARVFVMRRIVSMNASVIHSWPCAPKASSVGHVDISPLEPTNSDRLFFIQLLLVSVVLNAITIRPETLVLASRRRSPLWR